MTLSHYDDSGRVSMVDVGHKPQTTRTAAAHALVAVSPEALAQLPQNKKGDPIEVARIAGIMAAKKTSELIPLCHSLPLAHADVQMRIERAGIDIVATTSTTSQTGVEMEALTAATVAALTIYDMLKAADKSIEIRDIYLLEKTGGASGDYRRQP